MRRRFFEIAAAGAAPIATEALARIAELYAIEAEMPISVAPSDPSALNQSPTI